MQKQLKTASNFARHIETVHDSRLDKCACGQNLFSATGTHRHRNCRLVSFSIERLPSTIANSQ
ncbi:hypothetical protein PMAYCL1PPCAC_07855 [Pristionchus mayeri]|uniref:Uncharacterized protein n=1 Tax=Pristionchus mayeri TaxID=1317129 RepID=A0AAN4ZH98_9BILA|nr:hypothetical protein PMAYCL1PPCAC_07855 [Pristionchus mayeri]